MSTIAIHCVNCGVKNISTSQFCGGCGTQVGGAQPNVYTAPQTGHSPAVGVADGSKDWHEMAGLICGVVSMFLCGIIAAIPGLYFSWSARGIAKQQGRGTGVATAGLVLNGLGVLVTFAMIAIVIIAFAMATSNPQMDPSMNFNAMPYGY